MNVDYKEKIAQLHQGEVIVTLTMPDGKQWTDTILFEVLELRKEKAGKSEGLVPPFSIVPVDPYDQPEQFARIWGDVGVKDVNALAYTPKRLGDEIRVYYSTAFSPYRQQLEKIKTKPSLAGLFRKNYEIWIGYHAILQLQQPSEAGTELEGVGPEEYQQMQEHERALVAEMQAKQAIRTAEIQQEALKVSSVD